MMKKSLRILVLVLAAVLLLSGTAFAAGGAPAVVPEQGAVVTFQPGYEKLNVTYDNGSIAAGGLYMIFVVMADEDGNYTPTESSVLYINQVAASAAGTVTFNDVYPSKIANSAIMISGTGLTGPVTVAYIEVPEPAYILGDVDKSGKADVGDATMLLRYLARLASADKINMSAADVDGSGKVDVGDATKLLRVLAGLDSL